MKKIHLIISTVLLFALMISMASIPCYAVTLYTDGAYTYADIDDDYVALYSYDENSSELVVPERYLNRYVSSVYDYAFEGNKTITSVNFSNSSKLNTIGIKAFASCSNLSGTLTLPNSVRTIGLGAFEKCDSIKTVVINSSVQVIPQQCFNRCTSLSEVHLSPSVERIEKLAFANCDFLSDVYLSTTVNYISNTAFMNSNYVCFHVWNGSYALQYAEENQIDHIILDGDKIGDVNGDGVVDILDATEIQKYAAESTDFTDEQFELGDINKDGYCDVIDALLVQKSVIGAYELPQNIIRY